MGGYLFLYISTIRPMMATMSAQNRRKVSQVTNMYITSPLCNSIEEGKKIFTSSKRGSNRRHFGNSYGNSFKFHKIVYQNY